MCNSGHYTKEKKYVVSSAYFNMRARTKCQEFFCTPARFLKFLLSENQIIDSETLVLVKPWTLGEILTLLLQKNTEFQNFIEYSATVNAKIIFHNFSR